MFPKSSLTGVRRAHSFDSYDNLEKLDAVQEYRKQFLNTRAKFEKQSSVEPPEPPPRKHFGIRRQTSSEAACITDDLFSRQLQTLQDDLDLMVKETEKLLTGTHKNKGLYSSKPPGEVNKKFNDSEPKPLSSPVLVRRQIANNLQRQPVNEPVVLKKTVLENSFPTHFENVDLPNHSKSKSLGFERPHLQQDLNQQFNRDVSKTKFSSFSYEGAPAQLRNQNTSKSYSNGRSPEEQSIAGNGNDEIDASVRPIPAVRKKPFPTGNVAFSLPDSPKSYPEYKEQVANKTWRPVVSPGVHRSRSFQSSEAYNSPVRPESDSDKSRRLYLQSTLNNITSQQALLKPTSLGTSPYDNRTSAVSDSCLGQGKPRRTSTGSMHEPVVWRSRVPPMPVKTIAQMFSVERRDL